jgi:2-oxoglutarate ferredoxin oxidoreductase subunit gamma
MQDLEEIKIIVTGFGGQGIIMSGRIIGKAAYLVDGNESTMVQSYGPESRGGACNAQIIISANPIHYPYVDQADILICMSQGGYEKYIEQLKAQGTLIADEDLVNPADGDFDAYHVPASRMAEALGQKMMANIIMIGFLTAVIPAVSVNAARETIRHSVPRGTEELNLTAFAKGYDHGLAVLKGREKKAAGQTGAIA